MKDNQKSGYVSAMDASYKDGIERPFIKIGQNVWVADDSGVKKVKISKWLTQSVYLVEVAAVRSGYEKKIPIGTELCGVLVRFKDFGYYSSDQVCLFKTHHLLPNYVGGEPMFTYINGGTVAPRNDLEHYQTILNACRLQPNDYIRVDLETYANIKKITKFKQGLDGSEFEVVLTSGNRFFNETGFKKWQVVKGVLRRRPFRTNVTTTSLLSYAFDVYQLDISPLEVK
jgi:hypothetical protein